MTPDLSHIKDLPTRWRAAADYDAAMIARASARVAIRWRTPGWRLDHMLEMRRAMRAWKHFSKAMRATR